MEGIQVITPEAGKGRRAGGALLAEGPAYECAPEAVGAMEAAGTRLVGSHDFRLMLQEGRRRRPLSTRYRLEVRREDGIVRA